MKQEKEVILALCDGEEEYARLMTEYMQHQQLPWVIHTYTDVEKLLESEKEVDLLVVAESTYQEELGTLRPKRMIILNESDRAEQGPSLRQQVSAGGPRGERVACGVS